MQVRKPVAFLFLVLYALPAILIVVLGFGPRVALRPVLATAPSAKLQRPDNPIAVLRWKLPVTADIRERAEFGRKQVSAIDSRQIVQAALQRPGVDRVELIQGQADPVAWLWSNLQVSFLPSLVVMSELGPAAEDSACATTALGLALAPGQGAATAAALLGPGRFAPQPNGDLTVCISVDGDDPPAQAMLANAVAQAYLNQRLQEERQAKDRQFDDLCAQARKLQTEFEEAQNRGLRPGAAQFPALAEKIKAANHAVEEMRAKRIRARAIELSGLFAWPEIEARPERVSLQIADWRHPSQFGLAHGR